MTNSIQQLKLDVEKSIECQRLIFDNQKSFTRIARYELVFLYLVFGAVLFHGILMVSFLFKKFSVDLLFLTIFYLPMSIVLVYRTSRISKLSKLVTHKTENEIRDAFLSYAKENDISESQIDLTSMVFSEKTKNLFGSRTYIYFFLWSDNTVYYTVLKENNSGRFTLVPVFLKQFELRRMIRKTVC